jgi:hypothetical protein
LASFEVFADRGLDPAEVMKYVGGPSIEDLGPKLWAELHTAERLSLEWFNEWLSRIPGYCGCVAHFLEILAANPVRFDDFFAWSVEVHNAVNAYLGKPIFSLEEALQRWK